MSEMYMMITITKRLTSRKIHAFYEQNGLSPIFCVELLHIFLHELAHIYCAHHELDGKSFYDEYCEDYAQSDEEDGMINAGYAVWRECIAEIIAIECDDNCDIFPIRDKKKMLAQLRDEINQLTASCL